MSAIISFRSSCDEYSDVDVFIPDPDKDGAEWVFMVSRERVSGLINVGDVRYAPNPDAEFMDAEGEPQLSVMMTLAEAMPDVLEMLMRRPSHE